MLPRAFALYPSQRSAIQLRGSAGTKLLRPRHELTGALAVSRSLTGINHGHRFPLPFQQPHRISQLARCRPREVAGADTSELQKIMEPLEAKNREEAVAKFAAAGYVGKMQHLVLDLDYQSLEKIGMEPHALRTAVLKACSAAGPQKVIVVEDDMGPTETVRLRSKQAFDVWQKHNGGLKVLLPNGETEPVVSWEMVEDGATYYKATALVKQVSDLQANLNTWNGSLEEQGAERCLSEMLKTHPEAKRLCGVRELKNKTGQKREYDGIIVADNCVLIVEAKAQVDIGAIGQLASAIKFAREAAEQGADSLGFARRLDGSLKEIKGAVFGLVMVPGASQQRDVKDTADGLHFDIYLPNGNSFSLGNSCHPSANGKPNLSHDSKL